MRDNGIYADTIQSIQRQLIRQTINLPVKLQPCKRLKKQGLTGKKPA